MNQVCGRLSNGSFATLLIKTTKCCFLHSPSHSRLMYLALWFTISIKFAPLKAEHLATLLLFHLSHMKLPLATSTERVIISCFCYNNKNDNVLYNQETIQVHQDYVN